MAMRHRGVSGSVRFLVMVCVALGLALVGLALPPPAVSAATLTVNSTADVATNFGACGNTAQTTSSGSLREAVCAANNAGAASSTITVAAGTYLLTNGELQMGKVSGSNITLNGAGQASTIIDGNNASRVFDLDPGIVGGVTTSISGVTIRNGKDSTFGGAGIIAGSGHATTQDILTVSNSTITNNVVNSTQTNKPGGGISVNGGSLIITNSTISNNSSGNSPGGGVSYTAQGDAVGDQLSISGTTFSGNQVNASVANLNIGGGALETAVSAPGSPPTMTVTNSWFINNTVTGSGTGIPNGGAIFAESGPVNVTESTFTGNSASGGTNPAGGAISVLGGTANVHYNRITGNVATNGSGAYLGVSSGASLDASDNWWGCNSDPTTGATGCDTVSGTTSVNPRLNLTIGASATALTSGQTATVTASFLKDSANGAVAASNLGALTGVGVTWSASNGTNSATQATIQSNGQATATYTAGATPGPGSSSAEVDNQTATASFTVTVPPLDHFTIAGFADPTTAGTTANLTVTAQDSSNATVTGYTGTVTLTTNGPTVTNWSGTVTFTAGDNGVHTVSNVQVTQAASTTLTATDQSASKSGSLTFSVTPAAATHFTVSAPASATAGSAFNVTVTALDQYNNTATGYTGTVHFTSSDGQASLPANSTLANGVGTFSATLKTAGSQTLTATDTVSSSITGTSNSIAVSAAAATHFAVSAPASATAGSAFSFTVTALDQFNNTATGYAGTAHFTSSDGTATLPANSTLTNGVGTFSATLATAGNQTVTAADTVTSSINGTSNTIAVNAAAATHFTISAPSSATANVGISITVTALDQFNNTATGYGGTVHFTSSDGAATLPANSTLTNGVGTFSVTLKTAGNQTVTATDTISSSITGTSNSIAVSAGAATHFVVSAPASATAGSAFNLTVTALDAGNNTATGYGGTVHFASSDGQAALPGDGTLTNGVGTLSATLKTAGNQTITATDTSNSSITGNSNTIAVSAGAATHLSVTAPASATAGVAFSLVVTAQDAFHNTATGYTGTVHFTKTDTGPGSAVPADFPFTIGNAGTHTFTNGATLVTPGARTITATDTTSSSITGTSGSIAVNPATATHFAVAAPVSATAGTAFTVTVTAQDAFNNTATGYTGTIHFTSDDPQAVLPADSSLTNGVGTFSATLKTIGSRTITATDTATSSITGTSGSITVNAGTATHFTVTAPASATAGNAISFTVTALDAVDNTVTGYGGTVRFTSSDNQAALPANATLTNGTGTFSATLKTAGNQTITATDTISASVTGTSGTSVVSAGSAATITPKAATTPQTAQANTAFATALTVTVADAFGNPIVGANVLFAAPTSGASGTFAGGGTSATVATDTNGVATAPTFTANAATGSYTVSANLATGPLGTPASFALTNTHGPVTQIVITGLTVGANAKVGEVTQLTATATYADGTTQDVTSQVQWNVSDTNVGTVDATGKVTLKIPGSVTITATLGGVTKSTVVTVAAGTPSGVAPAPAPSGRPSTTGTTPPAGVPPPAPNPAPAPR